MSTTPARPAFDDRTRRFAPPVSAYNTLTDRRYSFSWRASRRDGKERERARERVEERRKNVRCVLGISIICCVVTAKVRGRSARARQLAKLLVEITVRPKKYSSRLRRRAFVYNAERERSWMWVYIGGNNVRQSSGNSGSRRAALDVSDYCVRP